MVIWYMVPGAYFFVGGNQSCMLESMVILKDLEGFPWNIWFFLGGVRFRVIFHDRGLVEKGGSLGDCFFSADGAGVFWDPET